MHLFKFQSSGRCLTWKEVQTSGSLTFRLNKFYSMVLGVATHATTSGCKPLTKDIIRLDIDKLDAAL